MLHDSASPGPTTHTAVQDRPLDPTDTQHPPHDGCSTDARGPEVLLRKEVIQPHLPVRLPCYDFVPIAGPTFDRSPPQGLGHGLRVLPTFVT